MNHSINEFEKSNLAHKSNTGAVVLIIITTAIFIASFVQLTNIA